MGLWSPSRTIGTLSWMLNNDPQRENDMFSPVNNPLYWLESFMDKKTWASWRFQCWGFLTPFQSSCLLRQTAFGVLMWQNWLTHRAFLCFLNTREAGLSIRFWSFLGKWNVTVIWKSRRKTYLESRGIIGLCIRRTNSNQLTNILKLFVGVCVGLDWPKSVLPSGMCLK